VHDGDKKFIGSGIFELIFYPCRFTQEVAERKGMEASP